ncbi:hypothetical protein SAMD00019534_047790 [Acytostelium subglobosum LB1]|uniref:hypothetical protein n=1 Tax=Acytostelium subglobosum LB1 TaxID=1410327 RepID=UPI000644CCAF|nr:hypothetical protein SAMD00019534_047790 [Acytostelium subglobosum LB1]GAM21604.1 hypothetical protein SAMD00019534_047790 [Acytostelium subglobosum LB1]|eukprot:XP_012755723.1 hypothetical protein SAMD00019534_047790 [Acytostelium subglobosum LB1]
MNIYTLVLLLLVFLATTLAFTPDLRETVFFDDFQQPANEEGGRKWTTSKYSEADYEIASPGDTQRLNPYDKGMLFPNSGKRYIITRKLDTPLDNSGRDLIVQFDLKLQKGMACGGAYIKLYRDNPAQGITPETIAPATPYQLLFGPDRCGTRSNQVQLTINHRNPVTNELQEKRIRPKRQIPFDSLSHLYTLHVFPNSTFTIGIDQHIVLQGDLRTDFVPPFSPPKEVSDPSDRKPADWVDQSTMDDPTARKPDDWDETQPPTIPKPSANKPRNWRDNEPLLVPAAQPAEWNEEEDGEWEPTMVPNPKCADGLCGTWEAPKIPNPKYKGKWRAPQVPNPAYRGVWRARQIPNDKYFNVENPYILDPIGFIAIEVWTLTPSILFDNVIITHSKDEADRLAADTWAPRHDMELKQQVPWPTHGNSVFDRMVKFTESAIDFIKLYPVQLAVIAAAITIPFIILCLALPSSHPVARAPSQPINNTHASPSSSSTSTTKTRSPSSKTSKAPAMASGVTESNSDTPTTQTTTTTLKQRPIHTTSKQADFPTIESDSDD